jgi:hypothetical protein
VKNTRIKDIKNAPGVDLPKTAIILYCLLIIVARVLVSVEFGI